MLIRKKILFIFLLLAITLSAQQRKTIDLKLTSKPLPFGLTLLQSEYKPYVSLALSGGGARGIAQLGVLKAFEEFDIKVDEIVGTSMGSIIGGLYSAGYDLEQLDSLIITAPWDDFFSLEETNRRELFLDQKITEDKAIFAIRLDGFEPVIPTAINTGQRVANFLNLLSLNAPINTAKNFNNLLYPFKAVSTNLVTGEPHVLSEGSLGIAMRASSSVSLVLEPVKVDSSILVDGGLVANVPVEIARQSKPDYLIAVDVTSPLRTEEELKYPWEIADQLVSIPMRLINERQLMQADVVVHPDVNLHKNDDFTGLRNLIDRGYGSTLKSIASIKDQLNSIAKDKIKADDNKYADLKVECDDKELKIYLQERLTKKPVVSEKEIVYTLINYNAIDNYNSLTVEIDTLTSVLYVNCKTNPIVENIIVNGAELIDADSIVIHSIMLKDHPFNSKKVLKAFLNILREYRNHGYSLARIKNYSFENGILRINIDEQRIDKLIVEGNERTTREVITRELPFEEGDVFIRSEIENGLSNLRSTGLFESVDLQIDQIDNRNVLTLKVVEKPSLLLRFGLRVDNEYFTQLSIDLRDENLLGTGTELGALFSGGIRNQLFAIEHKANRVFDTYLTYKIKAYYNLRNINTYQDDSTNSENRFMRSKSGEYIQSYLGGSVAVGAQFGKFGNVMVEGRYQRDKIKGEQDFPEAGEYSTNIAAIKFLLSIDSQDQYPFPTTGVYFNGFYETAQSAFGGDIGYSKLYLNYNSYFSLSDIHTLNLKLKFGYADETLPLSQMFSFGGQSSFYGYRDYEFRGRQIFTTSLTYRAKLPIDFWFDTYVKARYDLGSIWAQQESIRFKDLRHGVGVSLAFDTPVGPAEFSVGKSFLLKKALPDNIISWGETLFYFTIGYYY